VVVVTRKLAEHLLLAVADAGGGGLEPLAHRPVASNSSSPCSVRISPRAWRWKQRRVQALLQRANLAADGGLRQVQHLARMGQAAGIGHRVKNPELVPVHGATLMPVAGAFCSILLMPV
jgi:hypothetical protein